MSSLNSGALRVAIVHRSLAAETMGGVARLYRGLTLALASQGHQVTTVSANPCPWSADHLIVAGPSDADADSYADAVEERLAGRSFDVAECSSWEYELGSYVRRPRRDRAAVAVRAEMPCTLIGAAHLAAGEKDLLERAETRIAVSAYARTVLRAAYPRVEAETVIHNAVDRDWLAQTGSASLEGICRARACDLGAGATLTPLAEVADPVRRARVHTQLEEFLGDGDLPVLMWVGKITPMKGWPLLEAAAKTLRGRARLVVVLGHAPAFYPLTLRTGRHLTVLRDVPEQDMPTLYRSADAFLCTSTIEGYGLAVAEAIVAGTPVLVPSWLEATREFVTDHRHGRIYDGATDLPALVASLPRVGEGARRDIAEWPSNARRTAALYRSITDRRGVTA